MNSETLLITTQYVREALDDLAQGNSQNSTNPLQFLHLIDVCLLAADFSFFENPRLFALNEFLIQTIHDYYNHLRHLHNLPPINLSLTLAEAKISIQEDASTGNADLTGWSWLNHHYVEPNLRMTQQQFCQLVNLDDRTVRRYQPITIEQFRTQLIRMEQQTREVRRKHLSYLELPHQGTIQELIERENEIQLIRKSLYKHYFIVGAAGIGKTVLVEWLLKEQIDNDEIDRVIWINRPETTDVIQAYLHERLLGGDSKITIAEYMMLKKVAVVIDNVEQLQEDMSKLEAFLTSLSNATVYLTSHLFYSTPYCLEVELQELSFAFVETMLSTGRIQNNSDLPNSDYSKWLWQSIGGNPLALELLSQNWSMFELETATLFTLNRLYSQLFDTLPITQQTAWLLLGLLTEFPLDLASLSDINLLNVQFDDFVILCRLGIAKTSNPQYSSVTLTLSANKYIQSRYQSNGTLHDSLNESIQQIISRTSNASDLDFKLIEAILSANWVNLNTDLYIEAVRSFWKRGLQNGHFTNWYLILGRHLNTFMAESMELAIAYGICQRCLGQWSDAYSVFNTVALNAGMKGLFKVQAQALLELAILMRYQGNYADAISTIDYIEKLPPINVSDLLYQLAIQRIEIAIEQNDIKVAKLLFANLSDKEETRAFILQLELMARETANGDQDISVAELMSKKLLLDYRHSNSTIAKIHVLVARIFQKKHDTEAAIRHLVIAQSLLLETDNDPFGLARTQSNLAALFIDTNQLLDARELLKSAEYIQRQIGDRVGLATSVHNQRVLERKIVN